MSEEDYGPVAVEVRRLEQELGITPGFMESLLRESDWSFVIKTHAVLEAAVAHLLTMVVGEPRLKPFFARLELSGANLGKVAVAKLLDLLEDRDRRFIRSFSELRNDLVHDVRFVDFTFSPHVKAMDAPQLRSFRNKFDTWSVGDIHELDDGRSIPVVDFFRDNPKLATWYSAMSTVAIIYGVKKTHLDIRREVEEVKKWSGFREFAEKLSALSPLPSIDTLDNPEQKPE